MEMYNPPHPGIILKEEVIEPLNISIAQAAIKLGVSRQNLSGILNGHIGISSDMALRIEKAFNSSAQFWLRMQMSYDLWQSKQKLNLDNVQVMYG
jgi:addiction module HigA family antidote